MPPQSSPNDGKLAKHHKTLDTLDIKAYMQILYTALPTEYSVSWLYNSHPCMMQKTHRLFLLLHVCTLFGKRHVVNTKNLRGPRCTKHSVMTKGLVVAWFATRRPLLYIIISCICKLWVFVTLWLFRWCLQRTWASIYNSVMTKCLAVICSTYNYNSKTFGHCVVSFIYCVFSLCRSPICFRLAWLSFRSGFLLASYRFSFSPHSPSPV